MVTLTIDGRQVSVEEGTTILQAAIKAGIRIPHLCYHEALSIPANCRMCLIETNRSPKPVPACYELATEGLVVHTVSDSIRATQRTILEFMLLNHPIDCPICDQAGECKLQDYYAEFSLKPSRLTTPKVHKPKAKGLGPYVILDAERCILCTRCVRFCEEVAKAPELTVVHRGEHSEIDTFPGRELRNPYSLNTVDLCPVGALTSRDFRFKCRVWWLRGTASVCAECSRSCSIRIDTRSEDWRQAFKPHDITSKVVWEGKEQIRNKVLRLVPRYNPNVNNWWMCDEGRLAYHRFESGRSDRVVVRNGAGSSDLGYVEAIEILAIKLKEASTSPDSIAVLLTPFSTNEELYLTVKFFKEVIGLKSVFLGGRGYGFEDDILIKADKNPNRKGAELILGHFEMIWDRPDKLLEALRAGRISALLIFGDSHEKGEEIAREINPSIFTVSFSPLKNRFTEMAHLLFPTLTPYEKEGTFVNFNGVIQRVRCAIKPTPEARSEWEIVRDLASQMKVGYHFSSAEEIFAEMSKVIAKLKGMDYKRIGDFGEKI